MRGPGLSEPCAPGGDSRSHDSKQECCPVSAPSHPREDVTPCAVCPHPRVQDRPGSGHLSGPKPGVPFPTFTRSCRKHQGTHWGPAHSKQVLVGQLQGGQGLGLQHGVQVDVAIGPCAQEEVPGWGAGQKASMWMSAGVRVERGPSCQASRLPGPRKASLDPQPPPPPEFWLPEPEWG